MSSTATVPTTTTNTVPSLAAGELCDQCDQSKGAKVYASHIAYKDASNIVFCAHHASVNAESLLAKGWVIEPEALKYGI